MLALETIQKYKLFKGLTEEQLSAIQKLLKQVRFAKGEYILKENSTGDQMYLLVQGTVSITKELVKGIDNVDIKEKVLATLSHELFPVFGENGVLGHAPRTANVIALSECTLFSLSKSDFEVFKTAHLDAAYNIMANIARNLSLLLHTTDNNLVKLATAFYIAVQR